MIMEQSITPEQHCAMTQAKNELLKHGTSWELFIIVVSLS